MNRDEYEKCLEGFDQLVSMARMYSAVLETFIQDDEETEGVLNTYRGFFAPVKAALHNGMLLEAAKALDKNSQAASLQNLLKAVGEAPEFAPGFDASGVDQWLVEREEVIRGLRVLSNKRLALFLVVTLAVISAAAQAAAPIYIGRAVDGLTEYLTGAADRVAAGRGLTAAMVLVLVLFLVGWLTNAGSRYALAAVGQQLLLKLRNQIMHKVHELSLTYFDRNEAGDLLSRLTNDTEVINRTVGMGLSRLVSSFLLLFAILIGMLALNWRLALASFLLLPLMYVSTAVFSKRARSAFRKTRKTISGVSSELEQNISGARTAQAFNRQSWNSKSFRQLNRANRDANVGAESLTAAFAPTMDVISGIGIAVVLGYGGLCALGLSLVGGVHDRRDRQESPIAALRPRWTTRRSSPSREHTFQFDPILRFVIHDALTISAPPHRPGGGDVDGRRSEDRRSRAVRWPQCRSGTGRSGHARPA